MGNNNKPQYKHILGNQHRLRTIGQACLHGCCHVNKSAMKCCFLLTGPFDMLIHKTPGNTAIIYSKAYPGEKVIKVIL